MKMGPLKDTTDWVWQQRLSTSNTIILSESLAPKQDNTSTLAVTAQAPGQAWGRWSEQNTHRQPIETFYTMNISGLIQSYDSRAASSAAVPRLVQPDISYARNTQQGFIEEHYTQSPLIKSEPQWNSQVNSPIFPFTNTKTISTIAPITSYNEVNFETEVDTLMKAIQVKTQTTLQKALYIDQSRSVIGISRTPPCVQASPQARANCSEDASQFKLTQKDIQEDASSKGSKKRYQCTIENCTKSFYQKTHLDIHERAHTGAKPYVSNLLLLSILYSYLQ
jgi:uncharacterized Zn-finger protein